MLLNVVVSAFRTEAMQKSVDMTQGYQTKAECELWCTVSSKIREVAGNTP